jgi:Flp pilus assembly protein TadG
MVRVRERGQFRSNESGVAAVEFGFVAAMLCFLLVGLIDFGMGYWKKIQVGNAARAGAEYAMTHGWNQTAITTAVTSATGLSSISATPAPTQACGCPSASSGIVAASCGASCAGGGTAGTYITVNASATYSTLLSYPGIASSFALAATNNVRIN